MSKLQLDYKSHDESSPNQKISKDELVLQQSRDAEELKKKNFKRKCFIFYPIEENNEDHVNSLDEFKTGWDLFTTAVLVFSSFVIPYRMAFISPDNETTGWNIINYLIDFTFLLDIVVTFNTAFYDDNFKIVEDRC